MTSPFDAPLRPPELIVPGLTMAGVRSAHWPAGPAGDRVLGEEWRQAAQPHVRGLAAHRPDLAAWLRRWGADEMVPLEPLHPGRPPGFLKEPWPVDAELLHFEGRLGAERFAEGLHAIALEATRMTQHVCAPTLWVALGGFDPDGEQAALWVPVILTHEGRALGLRLDPYQLPLRGAPGAPPVALERSAWEALLADPEGWLAGREAPIYATAVLQASAPTYRAWEAVVTGGGLPPAEEMPLVGSLLDNAPIPVVGPRPPWPDVIRAIWMPEHLDASQAEAVWASTRVPILRVVGRTGQGVTTTLGMIACQALRRGESVRWLVPDGEAARAAEDLIDRLLAPGPTPKPAALAPDPVFRPMALVDQAWETLLTQLRPWFTARGAGGTIAGGVAALYAAPSIERLPIPEGWAQHVSPAAVREALDRLAAWSDPARAVPDDSPWRACERLPRTPQAQALVDDLLAHGRASLVVLLEDSAAIEAHWGIEPPTALGELEAWLERVRHAVACPFPETAPTVSWSNRRVVLQTAMELMQGWQPGAPPRAPEGTTWHAEATAAARATQRGWAGRRDRKQLLARWGATGDDAAIWDTWRLRVMGWAAYERGLAYREHAEPVLTPSWPQDWEWSPTTIRQLLQWMTIAEKWYGPERPEFTADRFVLPLPDADQRLEQLAFAVTTIQYVIDRLVVTAGAAESWRTAAPPEIATWLDALSARREDLEALATAHDQRAALEDTLVRPFVPDLLAGTLTPEVVAERLPGTAWAAWLDWAIAQDAWEAGQGVQVEHAMRAVAGALEGIVAHDAAHPPRRGRLEILLAGSAPAALPEAVDTLIVQDDLLLTVGQVVPWLQTAARLYTAGGRVLAAPTELALGTRLGDALVAQGVPAVTLRWRHRPASTLTGALLHAHAATVQWVPFADQGMHAAGWHVLHGDAPAIERILTWCRHAPWQPNVLFVTPTVTDAIALRTRLLQGDAEGRAWGGWSATDVYPITALPAFAPSIVVLAGEPAAFLAASPDDQAHLATALLEASHHAVVVSPQDVAAALALTDDPMCLPVLRDFWRVVLQGRLEHARGPEWQGALCRRFASADRWGDRGRGGGDGAPVVAVGWWREPDRYRVAVMGYTDGWDAGDRLHDRTLIVPHLLKRHGWQQAWWWPLDHLREPHRAEDRLLGHLGLSGRTPPPAQPEERDLPRDGVT